MLFNHLIINALTPTYQSPIFDQLLGSLRLGFRLEMQLKPCHLGAASATRPRQLA